jgi:hypothetical protein
MRTARTLIVFLLLTTLTYATEGSFRGTLIAPPDTEPAQGWLYVKGRNNLIRKVEVSHARVSYSEEPSSEGKQTTADKLEPGTEVRVTAEQDCSGQWRASEVEVINMKPKPRVAQQHRL